MLMNYITLEKDTPTRMHFTDHYYVEREIWDPDLGRTRWVRSLVLWCDELEGEPSARTLSVLATKLADLFAPYLEGNRYRTFDFVVTKRGEGFATVYTLEAIPRKEIS